MPSPHPISQLYDLRDQVEDIIESANQSDERALTVDDSSTVFLFYSLAWTEIEGLLTTLIVDFLIESGYQIEPGMKEPVGWDWDEELSNLVDSAGTVAQVEFLYDKDVIGGQEKAKIERTRGIRNRLVHNPSERYFPLNEFEECAEDTVDVIEELAEDRAFQGYT